MECHTQTKQDIQILSCIRDRKSIRAFSSRPIEREKIRVLLEAARRAPSSYNEQPWRFLIARKGEKAFEAMLECLSPNNRQWARQAAVLLLTAVQTHLTHSGKPNRYAWHDAGMALENLLLQAVALGIYGHPMGGFDARCVREKFGLPAEVEPVTITALGYPGAVEDLPEPLQKREKAPRIRKPLSALAFEGRWGNPFHPADE